MPVRQLVIKVSGRANQCSYGCSFAGWLAGWLADWLAGCLLGGLIRLYATTRQVSPDETAYF